MANIANLLTEHMAIWTAAETEKKSGRGRASGNAGSVYGVKKLRELILELAVSGKLVPQNQNDEPASELLKRIKTEKAKLIAQGKLRKEKTLAPIGEEEKPFELPKGWEWVRNCELFQLRKGRIPKSLNEYGLGLPYLDIDALDRNIIRRYSEELTCPQSTDKDILVVCDGSRSGLILDGKNGIIGSTLSIVDTPLFIQNYIKLIFKQGFEIFNTSMKGAAIPHLDTQKLLQNSTALPPLAEQHRIVAKVDALMALCDQLEQQHSNAQEAHENLVSQLLATLTQSQNTAEFNANWQRIYAHFDVLFTTEASIDALKQTLLQLAVMGKLVPQDLNDERASELLKRIKAEKAKLIVEGKVKKEKPLTPVSEAEKPFELPRGWEWARLETLSNLITKGSSPKWQGVNYTDNTNDVLFVTSENVGSYTLLLDSPKFVEAKFNEIEPRSILQRGDYLMNIVGASIGRTAIFDRDNIANINQAVCLIRIENQEHSKPYLLHFFNSETCLEYMFDKQVDNARPNLSMGNIANFLIPIPPAYEQHRIVAKVDALMALCEQLKTRIQQANQQQQTIADALVAQALQPISAEIIDLASYRNAVACYTIKQMQSKPSFGRTQAVKLLYLAQNHAGLGLDLQFERKAAGPLVQWIYDFEEQGIETKWFSLVKKALSNGNTKIEYQINSSINEPASLIDKICTIQQRKELDRLFGLFADKNTEEAEIIATLFAAWNDFLMDGKTPSDDQIIKEVRENWHLSKERFTPEVLKKWLAWIKDHQLTPRGQGSRTAYQPSLLA